MKDLILFIKENREILEFILGVVLFMTPNHNQFMKKYREYKRFKIDLGK